MRCFEDGAGNDGRPLRESRAPDDDSRSGNGNADEEPGDRQESGSTDMRDSSHGALPFAHETTVAPRAHHEGRHLPLGAML